ncbi:MAG: DUF4190 domain-containing protein [Candidatus Brocadiia bacterium]|nr:DUF4190 domain-containing protein [Candidatus Brocadiia bacterium]
MSDEPGASAQQPSGEAPLPSAQTSGLAKASLVFGLVGFVTFGLGGLVGLILGIWAMVRNSGNQFKRKGRGLAIAGICLSALSLPFGRMFEGFIRARKRAMGLELARKRDMELELRHRTTMVCHANLDAIGACMAMYLNDHGGEYPSDLDVLCREYVNNLLILDCPGRGQGRASYPGVEETGSYRYVGALHAPVTPGVIIMYDKAGNHPDARGGLFAGGDFEWIPEEQLAARLAESLRIVKQADWDEYSEERKREIEAFYTPEQTE